MTAQAEPWRQARERGGATTCDLSARLQDGDPAALAELAEVWGPRLYRYLYRLARDGELARDLTQEALLRALKALLGGAQPHDLLAWLYRIATNLARDDYRSAYRRCTTLCDEVNPGLAGSAERTVVEALLATRRQEAVRRAVQGLAPELREVIVLRFQEDQPVKVIAAVLGIPEGTVKSRLYRAYRALERQLGAWRLGGEEGGDG